jgi:hypothetical protein
VSIQGPKPPPLRADSIKTNPNTFGMSKTYYLNGPYNQRGRISDYGKSTYGRNRMRTVTNAAQRNAMKGNAARLKAGARMSRAMHSADLTAGHHAAKWLNRAAHWWQKPSRDFRPYVPGGMRGQFTKSSLVKAYAMDAALIGGIGGYIYVKRGQNAKVHAKRVAKRQARSLKRAEKHNAQLKAKGINKGKMQSKVTKSKGFQSSQKITNRNVQAHYRRQSKATARKNAKQGQARRNFRPRRDGNGRFAGSY